MLGLRRGVRTRCQLDGQFVLVDERVETGVDEVFARALALGASEASPLEDMEGVGRGGYLFDPDGNLFGLMSAVMSDGTNAMAG